VSGGFVSSNLMSFHIRYLEPSLSAAGFWSLFFHPLVWVEVFLEVFWEFGPHQSIHTGMFRTWCIVSVILVVLVTRIPCFPFGSVV
jgi:hypothetical protein